MTADLSDFYDAKATYYRDSATVVSIVFGFVLAALTIAFTAPNTGSAVALYALVIVAIILAIVLIALFWKMLQYDGKRANAAREKQ
jgi:Na+/proline symporter